MSVQKGRGKKPVGKILAVVGFVLLFAVAAGVFQFLKAVDGRYPWLWMYLADQLRLGKEPAVSGPKHLMFLYVDHFEPHDQEAMDRWMKEYPELAKRHKDADGKHPQHSFFWFFSQSDLTEKKSFLRQISQMVYEGYGELELHMHHANDTEETFLSQMNEAIQLSKGVGAFIPQEVRPRTAFGFIHGMWGLDNSRGAGVCGVTNELILLRQLGCYADLTNPSWGAMHPKMINRFYYATDDPARAKSYDKGPVMETGKSGLGDLFMLTGQSVVRFDSLFPKYDHGEIDKDNIPTPERIDAWVKNAVRVKGRPDWLFVKVFSHGAIADDHDVMLGGQAERLRAYLETKYNDGTNYVLHYISAREAYNIAKAAEAGKSGDPNEYRDFLIPPYINQLFIASVPFETISAEPGNLVVKFRAPEGTKAEVRIRGKNVKVTGKVTKPSISEKETESVVSLTVDGVGVVGFHYEMIGA